MKPKAYVFVFNGLADWEPALALCEIRKSGKYEVLTAGHSREAVVTMGGLNVVPDIAMDEIEARETAIFIVPGGNRWEEGPDQKVHDLLRRLHADEILIGALCSAFSVCLACVTTAGRIAFADPPAFVVLDGPRSAASATAIRERSRTGEALVGAIPSW